jgi:hypothetical protein
MPEWAGLLYLILCATVPDGQTPLLYPISPALLFYITLISHQILRILTPFFARKDLISAMV